MKARRAATAAAARAPASNPSPAETSFELVKRASAGDRDAENEICRRYTPRLYRWARGRVPAAARPAQETADVVQEVLIRAIRTFPDFEVRHEHSFPAYLRTILANKLLDMARAGQRRPVQAAIETVVDPPSREPSPFDWTLDVERHAQIDEAVKTLAPGDQALFFLRMELGCDYDEIVELLGRSNENALRVATRRAILRLGTELGRRGRT